ncbi:hypothetical protein EJB05_30020, partial [Eragrostis curvula]
MSSDVKPCIAVTVNFPSSSSNVLVSSPPVRSGGRDMTRNVSEAWLKARIWSVVLLSSQWRTPRRSATQTPRFGGPGREDYNMAQKTVLAGGAVESAIGNGVKRRQYRQVGPLPGYGVANDIEPRTLPLENEEAVQRMYQSKRV